MPNYEVSDLTRYVAAKIRGLMGEHGVTQAELADSIGVSQSQLSKMTRGVRPIDLDQLDGMCMALGVDTGDLIKEAEDTLSNYETKPNAKLLFVDEGIRRAEPIDTEGWGSNEPVIPEYQPRKRSSVSASVETADEDFDVTSEVRSAYGKAAHRGPRKADQPHAD